MRIGRNFLHLLWAGLQWLGGRIGNILVLTFWLLIQVLELLIWAVSELKARVKSGAIALKQVIKQKKLKLFLWPFEVVGRGVWEVIIQGFWLLIQLIELIVWYVEIVQKARQKNSQEKKKRSRK